MEEKKKRKIPWSTLYLILTIVVVIGFGIVNRQFGSVFKTLSTMSGGFLFISIAVVIAYFFFEGGIIHYLLRGQGEEVKFSTSMKIGIIGIYYSYITPSSTGGQPAQVLYLKRDNVSPGSSIAALFVKFFAFQTAFVICSVASLILMWNTLSSVLIPWIIVGICINSCWIVAIPLLFNNKILSKICKFLRWLVRKIGLIKNKDKYFGIVERFEEDFTNYTNRFMKKKFSILLSVLLSIPQVILQMGVLFFIFKAFGYRDVSFFEITAMQTLLQVSVCFMPMPGASGAQEIGFSSFFSSYFTNNDLFAAVMVWRFFTYYLIVLVGAGLVLSDGLIQRHKRKKFLRSL